MNSKTKIIVLRAKKLMYTGICIALFILFCILFFRMVFPKSKAEQRKERNPVEESGDETTDNQSASYIPGIYSSPLTIGGQTLSVEVTVSADSITEIRLVQPEESLTTMYPLLEPAFDSLAEQIKTNQSLNEISFTEDTRYTTLVLLDAVSDCLRKAYITYDISEDTP